MNYEETMVNKTTIKITKLQSTC